MKARKEAGGRDSGSSSDASQELDDSKITKPYVRRVLTVEPDFGLISVNLAFTKYGVVHQVVKELGWTATQEKAQGDWDLCWTDTPIATDTLIRMHFFQKINYIPGMEELARKNLLGTNLNTMRRMHPGQYSFFPYTWMLPEMYSQFRRYALLQKKKGEIFIAKPENMSQGKGIFLTNRLEDIENGGHYVIQQYIANPFLIDHLKFDLRLYVLIASTEPLKIYLYDEGLARFATEKYHTPTKRNISSQYTHLTNYAINKKNPNFVFNNSSNDFGTGHKRSLTSVLALMQKMGVDVGALQTRIRDAITKTIITVVPILSHKYRCSQPEQYTGNMCFHILGFDVLLDSQANPIILEVNHTPSFATDTPLDRKIKSSLIKDTLLLMDINLKAKERLFAKAKASNDLRIETGKRPVLNKAVREIQLKKAQVVRDQYEKQHLGGYALIYPTDSSELMRHYQFLMESARTLISNKNTKTEKHISLDSFKPREKSVTSTPSRKQAHEKPLTIPTNFSNISHFQTYKIRPNINLSMMKHDVSLRTRAKVRRMPFQSEKLMSNSHIAPIRSKCGTLDNLSAVNNRKREGSYLAPKVYDPMSCELRQGFVRKESLTDSFFID